MVGIELLLEKIWFYFRKCAIFLYRSLNTHHTSNYKMQSTKLTCSRSEVLLGTESQSKQLSRRVPWAMYTPWKCIPLPGWCHETPTSSGTNLWKPENPTLSGTQIGKNGSIRALLSIGVLGQQFQRFLPPNSQFLALIFLKLIPLKGPFILSSFIVFSFNLENIDGSILPLTCKAVHFLLCLLLTSTIWITKISKAEWALLFAHEYSYHYRVQHLCMVHCCIYIAVLLLSLNKIN